MKILVFIAAGGALGALGRHFVAAQVSQWAGGGFPWGILACNVLGSFVLGLLVEAMALVWSPPQELRALLIVGFLGAFTTFSTFSLDTVLLYERGRLDLAALYVGASVAVSIAALVAGLRLVRVFAS